MGFKDEHKDEHTQAIETHKFIIFSKSGQMRLQSRPGNADTSVVRSRKVSRKVRMLDVGRNTCTVSNSLLRGASNREGVCIYV